MSVSQKLIDNVNEIKTTLNEISVYSLDVKTAIELYYELAKKVNEVINELSRFEGVVSDEVIKQNESLLYLLGEGLKTEVVAKIEKMIQDGTIYNILNNKIFNDLNEKINTFQNKYNNDLQTLATKDDIAKISSGTPLFAGSITEMTDTTKNYVNTTDGYVYTYSSGNWVKTNVLYQSQGLQDKTVNIFKLDDLVSDSLDVISKTVGVENLIPFDKTDWEQGSLSNNSYPTSTVRLRTKDFIEVEQGAEYDLKFFNNFFTIGINEYNGNLEDGLNYVAWKGYFSSNQTYTPSPNVTKIKLLLAPVQSINPLTVDHLTNLSITLRKSKSNTYNLDSPINLKVATFNTGLWSDGLTTGVADDKVNEKGIEWRKLIGSIDCDLVLAQEFTKFFDVSKTIDAYDYIWKFKYKNFFRTDIPWTSSAILSKYVLKDTIEQTFTNGQPRKWIKSYIEINGIKICLINAHLSIQTDYNTARKQEQQELLSLMSGEDYVVLCGDFNAYTTDEFDIFKNNGYKLVNGGDFGWFDTWTNFGQTQASWSNKKIDNIIVSSNIDIQNVYVDNRDLSDHAPLIAELVIQ